MPVKKNNAQPPELLDLAKELTETLDLDALLRKVGAAAEQLIAAESSAIMLLDDDKQNLYFKVATGQRGSAVKRLKIPIGQGFAGWVAKHWKPILVNEARSDERFSEAFEKAAGFELRNVLCVPMLLHGELDGVLEVLNKKSGAFEGEDMSILSHLSGLAAAAISNARLQEKHRNFFANAIEILIMAIESRFPHTKGHATRTAQAACALAKALGLEEEDYKDLYYAAMLHDIGLLKCEEAQDLQHAVFGADLLKGIVILRGIAPLIRHHHEHWDGSGFPDKLKGEMIPLGSRILCLLETVEDVRLQGVHNGTLSQAITSALTKGSGKKFDPKVVKAFLDQGLLESLAA